MVDNKIAMTEQFRQQYRDGVSVNYSGILHMLFVASIALLVIMLSLVQLDNVQLLEWSVLPATLLLVNFAEYAAHRWLGHKKRAFAKLFYDRHTGDHHHFFIDPMMDFVTSRDWRVVLFPSYLILAFLVGVCFPGFWLLQNIYSINAAYLYVAGGILGYLLYEVLHFSYHIPAGHYWEKAFKLLPGWQVLRHLHVLHHDPSLMKKVNFNITLPVFDLLFATLYWKKIA